MVEMILYNEIKMPVGASSERLMSESLNCSFKRFVQTADSSDYYARTNETLTERLVLPKNLSDLILLYLLIELFIKLLSSRNGENVE